MDLKIIICQFFLDRLNIYVDGFAPSPGGEGWGEAINDLNSVLLFVGQYLKNYH